MNFVNNDNRLVYLEGMLLQKFLSKNHPKNIAEIGPGSGFFTRQILDHASLEEYISLEVNSSFSNYLENVTLDYGIKTKHFNADYKSLDMSNFTCDTIIAIECFYHMHDRQEFIDQVIREMPYLQNIVFHDPAHYLPRLLRLLRKMPRYFWAQSAKNDSSWSTHHFLTIGEFRRLEKMHPETEITFQPNFGPRFYHLAKWLMAIERIFGPDKQRYPLSRYLMTSISGIITLSKKSQTRSV